MKANKKKSSGKAPQRSGKSAQRTRTVKDLEVTDRDQEAVKGGGFVGQRKPVGKERAWY